MFYIILYTPIFIVDIFIYVHSIYFIYSYYILISFIFVDIYFYKLFGYIHIFDMKYINRAAKNIAYAIPEENAIFVSMELTWGEGKYQ